MLKISPGKIISFLTSADRSLALLLVFFTTILALFETLGAASLMPMLLIVFDPLALDNNQYVIWAFKKLNTHFEVTEKHFKYLIIMLCSSLILVAQSLKIISTYFTITFGQKAEYNISMRLLIKYTSRNYSQLLANHSSYYNKMILADVGATIGGVIIPYLNLISSTILIIFLSILLLITNPYITLSCVGCIVFTYLFIYLRTKTKINNIGKFRNKANDARFKIIGSIFEGIKEIKMTDTEDWFSNRFRNVGRLYAKYQAQSEFFEQMPRFIIETIVFVIVIIFVLSIMGDKGKLSMIPTLVVFLYATYRVLPALQSIYASFSKIQYFTPLFEKVYSDLSSENTLLNHSSDDAISFNRVFTLSNVEFYHTKESKHVLRDINIEIPAGSMNIIHGPSGSGKTTLLDIIMGLYQPQNGKFFVDGRKLDYSQLIQWRKLIGYVSQNMYIQEGTFAENIAFASDKELINDIDVIAAAKLASIHDFIINLPNGYNTILGERGSNISGGQRQRIGIARALYRKPKILILDEATNGLDKDNEQKIYKSLQKLKGHMTIIVVTHQLTNLNLFDNSFKLSFGSLVTDE